MNCTDFDRRLDEHLDGALDAATDAELLRHVAACATCAARREAGQRLREALRALPVPPPPPGFAERVLARARAARPLPIRATAVKPRRHAGRWLVSAAIAASLALGLGLRMTTGIGLRDAQPSTPVARLAPARTAGVQPLRLVFRSERALAGVTIELGLPEGMELAGYPGQRELVWQSDLQAGANLLELPVLLQGPGGVLTATVNVGAERRQFAVRVIPAAEVAPDPAPAPRRGALLRTVTPTIVT